MGKSAFTAQQKYEVIVSYEDRKTSSIDFCRQYNVSDETIKEWIYQFQT
ncbi:transposase, partial [Psychrobacillus psychrodurans]